MKYTASHSFTSPSLQFNKVQTQLAQIAAYAKAANETGIFNQIKEMHDNMSRQFNTGNAPKKKSWFQSHFGYDTETLFSAPLLEDNISFKTFYEIASKSSFSENRNTLYSLLNSVLGNQSRKAKYVNDNLDDYTEEEIEQMRRSTK
jgi:hypothetical protein